ncbi:unnamed protein product [Lactuca virosa]|uniref:THH1/TOM1/TOM3 domain-containing protein n=1 Tax=Lactuca virosa TaxID=75947 RepID=A0AAU9NSK8_9ASTR|nr:unnamed protein product [Lactuca virosa]
MLYSRRSRWKMFTWLLILGLKNPVDLGLYPCPTSRKLIDASSMLMDLFLTVVSSVQLEVPDLLFFSTYTLFVLFLFEIYHQAKSLPTDKLRIVYVSVNAGVYLIQVRVVFGYTFGWMIATWLFLSCLLQQKEKLHSLDL